MQTIDNISLFDFYQQTLVRKSALIHAMPTGNDWYLKLINMSSNFSETIWDISYIDGVAHLKLTRFLSSLWSHLEQYGELRSDILQYEVSEGELRTSDFTVTEVNRGIVRNCLHHKFNEREGEQYKLLFIDSDGPYEADITNPHQQENTEHWQRLINRMIGTGLSLPRRFVAA